MPLVTFMAFGWKEAKKKLANSGGAKLKGHGRGGKQLSSVFTPEKSRGKT